MTKLLILLAVISTCSAGIIPKDFRANEHISQSKSEISDGDHWDNCFKKVRFGQLKSVPTRRMHQDEKDSGTKEHHRSQLTENFQNSVHENDGGELKNAAFAEGFVVYADPNKDQRSLKDKFGIHTEELKTTENSLSEIFRANFDSPKESKLRDSKEEKLDQQTERFQIPLQNTEVGEDDKTVFSKSFVEYADVNKSQRSLNTKIQKQNISELEIGENLRDVLVANVDTSVDNKPTYFEDNLKQSTEELQTFLQRTGDRVLNKAEVFTESFVEYVRSDETEEFLAEFQKPEIKEIKTVVNFSETTVASFNISENSKMEVHDINTDSSEINLTDTEESSVFDLIASAINASDVFEYLNLTDSLSFDVVTENISSGFLDMDETALMSEGSEIALFQDDSTTGFEFLIDSETTKNLILTELLRSENFVVTENGKIGFLELSDTFPEIELSESDTEKDNLIGIIKTNNLGIPVDGTLHRTEGLDVSTEIEVENNKTVMNISVISATVSAEEAPDSTNLNSPTKFEEHLKVTDETHFLDDAIAFSPDSSKTCPAPGICFLWFFVAQDKCSNSSECRGSSMCCKMGCSKICVDV